MRLFSRRKAAHPAATHSSRLNCLQLETRIVPAMTLHKSPAHPHGTLLAHIDLQSVYMGSGWTNDPNRVSDVRFFETFTKFIPTAKAGLFPMLTKARYGVGSGKSEAGYVDSLAIGATISDAQIQAELQALITAGKVQQPNKNRLYQVFVAPGVKVTTPFGDSQFDFCAYHDAFSGTDAKGKAWPIIAYSVMPYQGTGVNAQNADAASGLTLSHIDAITVAASHEMMEAATDTIPGQGWWDENSGNENADVVNAQDVVIGGFVVQKNVAPDLTTIVPKHSVPYAYFVGGAISAVTTNLISAFTPIDIGFNTGITGHKGVNWLVPGTTYSQNA